MGNVLAPPDEPKPPSIPKPPKVARSKTRSRSLRELRKLLAQPEPLKPAPSGDGGGDAQPAAGTSPSRLRMRLLGKGGEGEQAQANEDWGLPLPHAGPWKPEGHGGLAWQPSQPQLALAVARELLRKTPTHPPSLSSSHS